MTPAELVEKVARAMWEAEGPHVYTWELTQAETRAVFRLKARAAIATIAEALRVPSDRMILRGVDEWHRTERLLDDQARDVWTEMLAASPLGKEDKQ
ncbi:hypothetical protein UFOVP747_38 [uncultured Caudovirales phage]|uniref:Uncharacterized protein n=1 Tax=uncultured Caudovirales phage TaxID=2100421 RepID=A0A6J5NDS2_9CAUD|nr:hypothetical protein UFOVP675_61 [uncultured Caudovirales phage]CAB5225503.1 hypothetical protein UFOVP747_38 [uncultured Caudovirales phage]